MSIIDHFDKTPDAGFTHRIDPATARRQFNMSLALVAVLTVATVSAAFSLSIQPQAGTEPTAVKMVVQAPQLVHVHHAWKRGDASSPGG